MPRPVKDKIQSSGLSLCLSYYVRFCFFHLEVFCVLLCYKHTIAAADVVRRVFSSCSNPFQSLLRSSSNLLIMSVLLAHPTEVQFPYITYTHDVCVCFFLCQILQIYAPFDPQAWPPPYCTVYTHLVKSGGTSLKDQLQRQSVQGGMPKPGTHVLLNYRCMMSGRAGWEVVVI